MKQKENQTEISFGYRFAMLHRLQMGMCRKDIIDQGLLPSHLPFVICLSRNNGHLTQDELSEAVCIDKGTTARAISRLEKDGFVRRKVNPKNRRQNLVKATSKAHSAAQSLLISLGKASDSFVIGFSEKEKEIVLNLLDRMLVNAREKLNQSRKENIK